jgi:hypothetical protein
VLEDVENISGSGDDTLPGASGHLGPSVRRVLGEDMFESIKAEKPSPCVYPEHILSAVPPNL